MAGRRHVFFDTSAWSAVDLLDLYRRVPPEQILYASDYPYGQQPASLLLVAARRAAAGYDEPRLRGCSPGTRADRRRRRAARADRARSAPRRPRAADAARARSTSTSRWRSRSCGRSSPTRWACSALAINACAERDGHPERPSGSRPARGGARPLAGRCPELDDPAERMAAGRLAFRLLHIADIEAVTAA